MQWEELKCTFNVWLLFVCYKCGNTIALYICMFICTSHRLYNHIFAVNCFRKSVTCKYDYLRATRLYQYITCTQSWFFSIHYVSVQRLFFITRTDLFHDHRARTDLLHDHMARIDLFAWLHGRIVLFTWPHGRIDLS